MKKIFVNINGEWYSKEALKEIETKGFQAKIRKGLIRRNGQLTLECIVIDHPDIPYQVDTYKER